MTHPDMAEREAKRAPTTRKPGPNETVGRCPYCWTGWAIHRDGKCMCEPAWKPSAAAYRASKEGK